MEGSDQRMSSDMAYQYIAYSEQDTDRLADRIAKLVTPGMVLTLDGDLGAGKTRFAQGFAASLGVKELVNSPTFTIIKEYMGQQFPFYHMDVYRISLEEAEDLGLDDYFFGDGVTLLEWSDVIAPLLPAERLALQINVDFSTGERHFTLIPYGQAPYAICESLKEDGMLS